MSKPIFIIRIPEKAYSSSPEKYQAQLVNLKGELTGDYHVITLVESQISNVRFECFNAINATDIEIKDLKDRIQNRLDNIFNQSDSEPGFDFEI